MRPVPRPALRLRALPRATVLAALVAGEEPPPLAAERRERALAGLARDGLIVRDEDGTPRLP